MLNSKLPFAFVRMFTLPSDGFGKISNSRFAANDSLASGVLNPPKLKRDRGNPGQLPRTLKRYLELDCKPVSSFEVVVVMLVVMFPLPTN